MRVHCLCLKPHGQMAKQLKIHMLLISSHCQSLFNHLTGVFHPHLQYLSCGLNVQRPSIDQTLGQQEDPGWMFWGVTGKSHQRLQVGKAFQPGWSRKTAGEKPLSAVALPLLCSDPKSSTAAGQIWAVGSGMAPELEVGALLGLSCAAQKEIPADKLIFALVVYLG